MLKSDIVAQAMQLGTYMPFCTYVPEDRGVGAVCALSCGDNDFRIQRENAVEELIRLMSTPSRMIEVRKTFEPLTSPIRMKPRYRSQFINLLETEVRQSASDPTSERAIKSKVSLALAYAACSSEPMSKAADLLQEVIDANPMISNFSSFKVAIRTLSQAKRAYRNFD